MRYNPFRPNSIATSYLFQGRKEEMQIIEQSLYQTKNGNPQHFLVEGERGLGKSSLFLMVEKQATGKLPISKTESVNFLVINIELDSTQSFFEILKSIAADFKRSLTERDKVKNLVSGVWEFLSNWEILGVRYHKIDENQVQPYAILNDLVINFERVIKLASKEVDGILILIDEADRPNVNASLGELVKLLTEKLTKRGCDQVVIGMTGQPGLISKLRMSHESSPRIFRALTLKPLSDSENKEVVLGGLEEANKVNSEQTLIDDDALVLLSQLSEGYPHFLQEFAYKAFESDVNNALQALKTRNIIIPNPSQPGEFRLPTKSFAAWIKAFYKLEEEPFTDF